MMGRSGHDKQSNIYLDKIASVTDLVKSVKTGKHKVTTYVSQRKAIAAGGAASTVTGAAGYLGGRADGKKISKKKKK